jgi:class 3 adenylate cyclase/HAMP domain-containing protein
VRIRSKIIIVVLPLVIAPLAIMGLASIYTARNGVTSVAVDLMRFKAQEIAKYASSQWTTLRDNGLADRPDFVAISRTAIDSFARSMVRGESELILAVDDAGAVAFASSAVTPLPSESRQLVSLSSRQTEEWAQMRIGGVERVGVVEPIPSFGWHVLVTTTVASFYAAANQILVQSLLILVVFVALSIILIVVFSQYLTRPLRAVVESMGRIVASADLSERVTLYYRDETGELGNSFNMMTEELQGAYKKIKGYALDTAIAQRREQKIRNIFQKYVPAEVIDIYYSHPEKMLIGDNRLLAVLFSDIRGFTTISERMRPEKIVESLNDYFSRMVDAIITRRGVVDKYIGDAIMAFFGAPVRHDDDAYQSVLAGLDMLDALLRFNADQQRRGLPGFHTGTGINYGMVTVGNIGSEKKMDYTVIGDMVNLASRLEGLTKVYHEPLIISESVHKAIDGKLPCRMLDRVTVKGKTTSVRIYCVRRQLTPQEEEGWGLHALGLDLYYKREFVKAASCFDQVRTHLPGDELSAVFARRCRVYRESPPPAGWDGTEVIAAK